MPVDEKQGVVTLNVYSVKLDKSSVELSEVESLHGINASFRYNANAFEMIVLVGAGLENGVAIADYNDELNKVVVFYTYDKYGRLMEDVELGQFLESKTVSDMSAKIGNLLAKKENPRVFIVDSYEDDEGVKITKLLPVEMTVELFKAE